MNKNNLENLKAEMKGLKFDKQLIAEMEKNMEKDLPAFQLKTTLPSDKGQMDATLHFKQSGQSDYYFFNKFELAYSAKAKPLENEQKYMVISPGEQGKNMMRSFQSPVDAMEFFKSQKGASELALGKPTEKDLQFKTPLATMKDGKVDYVAKDFQQTYYGQTLTNSFYVDKGKGFNVTQAANMLQGRSAFRDDLVSRAGVGYQAWNVIAFDKPKDNYGNYKIQQYNENYGFDLKQVLAEYKINMPDDPKKQEAIYNELKDGNRPVVSVTGTDGKEVQMRIEAVPRYGNINFYHLNGKPEKREDLQKAPTLDQSLSKGQEKQKGKAESHEMSM
ncbi:hypothetical protein [Mucilaginibacter paludis]|uniref:DUF3945 domain-containing protein n=1 Tax=Mucilaginibacter paludis DSM 18603 TaxID=714943 RepID=H1YEA4_9SPHI|nr:hypothetical protein [Mucilaginibacter paludis]EHQ26167.1 hypothetical protein Mucpa_2027 [Mucilaginibacter paludis DSM 18603]